MWKSSRWYGMICSCSLRPMLTLVFNSARSPVTRFRLLHARRAICNSYAKPRRSTNARIRWWLL